MFLVASLRSLGCLLVSVWQANSKGSSEQLGGDWERISRLILSGKMVKAIYKT